MRKFLSKLWSKIKKIFRSKGKEGADMSFGLEVRSDTGEVILDNLSNTARLYLTVDVPALGSNGSWTYSDPKIEPGKIIPVIGYYQGGQSLYGVNVDVHAGYVQLTSEYGSPATKLHLIFM